MHPTHNARNPSTTLRAGPPLATCDSGSGSAQEVHFAAVILGSADQHDAQQEAVRSRQGSSRRQATHHDGRTIRSASRPTNDKALLTMLRTRALYRGISRSVTLKNENPSRIVPAMKRALLLVALVLVGAAPLLAQTNEFGVLVGGSRRFVRGGGSVKSITGPAESDWIESNFSFGNNSVELYWSMPMEPELNLKFKGGFIDTEIAIPYEGPDPDDPDEIITLRRDAAEGQVQHIEALVEYKFEEPFGSSGLFAGLGMYRLTAPDEEEQTTWGVNVGVNADFPITRRYGVVLEGSYHWTHAEFSQRFLTLGGGFRISF